MFTRVHNWKFLGRAQAPTTGPSGTNPLPVMALQMSNNQEPVARIEKTENNVTPEGVRRVIEAAERFIQRPTDDLAYAEGKMDTDTVELWLSGAVGMLARARAALESGNTAQAVAYSHAGRALAGSADMLMAQTLGIRNLPGFSRSDPENEGWLAQWSAPNPDRTASNRELQNTNEAITRRVRPASSHAEAGRYLAQARNAYTVAYDAFSDGNYTATNEASWLAQCLLQVVDGLIDAGGGTNMVAHEF